MVKVELRTEHSPLSGEALPNGTGAAAILAAGIGSAALGVFALAGDAFPSINRLFHSTHRQGRCLA